MNIVAKTDLTFQNFTFSPVTDSGEIWFTSAEIAKALKYKKTDSVSQIYARNADEFTDSMTTTLKMKVVRKTGDVEMVNRLFSLRGAHLIAMFSNTPVAKEFRKWVLDILDREVTGSNLDEHLLLRNLTTAYQCINSICEIWKEQLSPSLRKLNWDMEGRVHDLLGSVNGPVYASLKHLEGKTKVRLTH
ncbi:TPA: hypothetical protein U2M19_001810 [Providencia rettgeri]|nr:hypothetical protein [Providencia rettgeri]